MPPPTSIVGLDHLRQRAGLADQQIVGQQHRERLVADQMARAPHGMAEPKRLLLAREAHRAGIRQAFQKAVQFRGLVALGAAAIPAHRRGRNGPR